MCVKSSTVQSIIYLVGMFKMENNLLHPCGITGLIMHSPNIFAFFLSSELYLH